MNRLPFISALEEQVLLQVTQLGLEYNRLEQAVADQETSESVYMHALCEETCLLLVEYRNALISLEQEYLQDRVFTLVSLKYRLSKYYSLLPELNRLLRQSVSGMQVLDLVLARQQEGG